LGQVHTAQRLGLQCTVVAVLKDDYPVQDSHGSIDKAESCFKTPKEKMFKENLAEKKRLFPSKHPYLPKGCGECGKTLLAYNPKSIWCKACGVIRKLFKKECESKKEYEKAQRIAENKKEYERYKNDPEYIEVKFNPENGGVKAIHKLHNFDKVGGEYEKDVQNAGYNAGHSVIFTSEKGKPDGEKYTEGIWDGLTFEIGTSCGTGKNNIKKIMQHCYSKRAQIAIINFKDSSFFQWLALQMALTITINIVITTLRISFT